MLYGRGVAIWTKSQSKLAGLAVPDPHPAVNYDEVVCLLAVAFTIDNIDPCYGGKEVSHADKDKRKVSFCCRVFSCHGDYSGPFFHTYMESGSVLSQS